MTASQLFETEFELFISTVNGENASLAHTMQVEPEMNWGVIGEAPPEPLEITADMINEADAALPKFDKDYVLAYS